VPDGATVLDVGCASGYLAAALAERGCTTYGVEPEPVLAAQAREHCARVFEVDIEQPGSRDELPRGLDAVLFGDVLEHLRDPWEVLGFAHGLLRPGGVAFVSVPNAVHWRARREILRGRFPLEDSGTFDRTHLRWFTRDSARELTARAGFQIERERFTPAPLPLEGAVRRIAGGTPESPRFPLGHLRWFLSRRAPRLFALQFVFVLRRA
jgi:2-polyprenyl-3-methyl-5-hydroxy-6-metoxy-1,4-benzoquinol methylase